MAQREYIRYLRFPEGLSIRAIAKRLGCHRETVCAIIYRIVETVNENGLNRFAYLSSDL